MALIASTCPRHATAPYETRKAAIIALTRQAPDGHAGRRRGGGRVSRLGGRAFVTGHALVVDGGLTIQLQEDYAVRMAEWIRAHPETRLPS